ncbi:MAG: chromosome segregation protein SMC [Chloroflexota bacterium]
MFLKALSLHGFKTFAQPTHFTFGPGVTAVVGPNGSGKSNVADAIRWVLGEQSFRSLRGRRTEDILFAGRAGRPPAAMADVTLTFDNSGHWLDTPFEEVTIARRAYRSGENEYFLNRDRTRLRDLGDLLGRISLGTDGFAIVGQGTVDAALSLRPEDRRGLIEQAAAIRHLYARLDESRQRLALARQNLERVSDLIGELAPKLKSLERQARQARERAAWQAELHHGLIRWYAHLWSAPRSRLSQATADQQAARTELESLAIALASSAATLATLRADQASAESAIASARQRAQDDERAIEASDQATRFGLTRRADLGHQREELASLLERRGRDLAAEHVTARAQANERAALAEQLSTAEEKLAALEAQSADWQRRRQAAEQSIREAQRHESRAESRRATAIARQRAARDRLEQLQRDGADHDRRIASLEGDSTDRQRRVDANRHARDEAEAAAERARGQRRAALECHDRCDANAQRLASEMAEIDRQLHGLRARLDAILHVESAGTAYFAGVRSVLQAANGRGQTHLHGIVDVVARLLTVSVDHELAIETALGSHLQDVVVDRWADAEAAIAYLKQCGAGRATFLPLDTIRPSRRPPPPTGPGLLGVASSLVDVEPRYQIVSDYLLGQTLVVDDLAVARRVIRECAPVWQIVTVEGDLTRSSGVVTGGAPGQSHGTLARQRELRQQRATIAQREAERASLATALAQARQELERAAAGLAQLTSDGRHLEDRARLAAAALAEEQRQNDRASHALALAREERQRVREQLGIAEKSAAETDQEVVEAERAVVQVAAVLADAQSARTQLDREVGAGTASLATRRSERDTLKERLRAAEAAVRQTETHRQQIETQVAEHQARLARVAVTIEALDRSDRDRGTERARLAGQLAGAREDLTAAESRSRQVVAAEREHQAEHQRLQALHRALTDRLRESERRADVARTELDGLRQQVLLEIGPLDDDALAAGELKSTGDQGASAPIEPLSDPVRVRIRLDSLRHRLRSTSVSSEAIGEFEEARQRLGFLTEQSLDLQRTIATLGEAIEETRSTMKARFDQTFAAVAGCFSRRFVELFGGGSARLVAADNEAGGVDVIAQPPGKRAESLAVLSGGERALVAAALLFALIEASPPPFCVLDEVDAAMDESNVGRFCQALRSLSERTQFIVITHNRRTMEAASTIYGLAVENLCESRVLSLRLPSP